MKDTHTKKFFSSDHLYFLPILKKMNPSSFRSTSKLSVQLPTQAKPIQQIVRDNSTGSLRRQHNASCINASKVAVPANLYNKYEFLPKIYSKRYKKDAIKTACLSQQPTQVNKSTEECTLGLSSSQTNKENKPNFDSVFYRDRFNLRLEKEVQKITFKLNTSISHNNLLLASVIEEQPGSAPLEGEGREIRKVKYTRLQTESEERKRKEQLQKVPQFLLKILQPSRQAIPSQ